MKMKLMTAYLCLVLMEQNALKMRQQCLWDVLVLVAMLKLTQNVLILTSVLILIMAVIINVRMHQGLICVHVMKDLNL